jgi:hypothetical protein
LALVVIDEQQRFGVEQRAILTQRHPVHTLYVTATPIPRTFARLLSGEIAISPIEKRPGAASMTSYVLSQDKIPQLAPWIQRCFDQDQRVYWVCPAIVDELSGVETRWTYWNEHFPGKVGILHGRMNAVDKEASIQSFRQGTTPQEVAQVIFGSLQRRFLSGRDWGVIVIAEGVLDLLSPESSKELRECPRDELGRIKYSQIELGDVIKPELQKLCDNVGHNLRLNTKNIGYELRCHPPVSFDVEYTKFLGFGAVRHLLDGRTDGMVTRSHDAIGFQPLSELVLADGSIRSRTIDLESDLYRVARSFMIR